MVLITTHAYRGNHGLITHEIAKMKDSSEESSLEIVNSDDEIVVAVGRETIFVVNVNTKD